MSRVPEEGFIFKLENYIVIFFRFRSDIVIRDTLDSNENTTSIKSSYDTIHHHRERKASRNLAEWIAPNLHAKPVFA